MLNFKYLPFFSLDNQEFPVIAIQKMIKTDNNKNLKLFMHRKIAHSTLFVDYYSSKVQSIIVKLELCL